MKDWDDSCRKTSALPSEKAIRISSSSLDGETVAFWKGWPMKSFTWLVFFSLAQSRPNPAEGGVSGSVHPPERSSWSSSSSPLLPVDVLPVCSHCLKLSTSKTLTWLFCLWFYLMVKCGGKGRSVICLWRFLVVQVILNICHFQIKATRLLERMSEEISPLDSMSIPLIKCYSSN